MNKSIMIQTFINTPDMSKSIIQITLCLFWFTFAWIKENLSVLRASDTSR